MEKNITQSDRLRPWWRLETNEGPQIRKGYEGNCRGSRARHPNLHKPAHQRSQQCAHQNSIIALILYENPFPLILCTSSRSPCQLLGFPAPPLHLEISSVSILAASSRLIWLVSHAADLWLELLVFSRLIFRQNSICIDHASIDWTSFRLLICKWWRPLHALRFCDSFVVLLKDCGSMVARWDFIYEIIDLAFFPLPSLLLILLFIDELTCNRLTLHQIGLFLIWFEWLGSDRKL